jgi:putative lipoic acid-binding regulatory protein
MKGLPSIELLESVHTFPGRYMFKAFGENSQQLVDAARDAAAFVTGSTEKVELSYRPSAKGNHACVTLDVLVESALQVQQIYLELFAIPQVRLLL